MRRRIATTLLLTIWITLSFTSHVFSGAHEKLVDKYIQLSGVDEMLLTFPDQIEAMSAQRLLTSEQPDLEKKITIIMTESFDVRLAEQNIYSYLLKNTDINFLANLTQWFETPLAQKIKEEEISSYGPDSQAELLHYIAELQTNPPSENRIAIIQELEKTTSLSELSANIAIEMMRGMFESFELALPEDKRQAMGNIEEEIRKIKPMIQESLRQQMILSSFYAYKNISNEELIKYIEFYKSNTGKKEIKVTGDALAYVLRQWFVDVGEKIIILAKEESENQN